MKILILCIKIIVSAGFVYFLINEVDFQRLLSICSSADIRLLVFAPIFFLFGFVFSSLRWRLILKNISIHRKLWDLLKYYFIGSFYNIFLPGAIGGDVVRIGLCSNYKTKNIVAVTSTIMVERLMGIIMVFFAAFCAFSFLPPELTHGLGQQIFYVVSAGSAFALAGLLLLKFSPRILESGLIKKIGSINKITDKIYAYFRLFSGMLPGIMVRVLILSGLFQSVDILCSFILSKAIGIDLPVSFFFTVIPLVYICTIVPISLGGLGVREGALAFFLTRVGVMSSDAVTLSFLLYFNRIIVGILGGIILMAQPSTKLKSYIQSR